MTSFAVPEWLHHYRREWLQPDLVAGLTLAAYLLPAGIGDASLAGLAPEAGLYACLFSGLVFWIFCSSKHTVITVTSALSLLIGASVGDLSASDPARHAALAACVALLVAVDRVCGVAGPRRQCDQLLLRNRARGLQSGAGALSGEHAASKALRVQRHARRLLGVLGVLRRTSGRHARGVSARGNRRSDGAHRRQALVEAPAGCFSRGAGRYARGCDS